MVSIIQTTPVQKTSISITYAYQFSEIISSNLYSPQFNSRDQCCIHSMLPKSSYKLILPAYSLIILCNGVLTYQAHFNSNSAKIHNNLCDNKSLVVNTNQKPPMYAKSIRLVLINYVVCICGCVQLALLKKLCCDRPSFFPTKFQSNRMQLSTSVLHGATAFLPPQSRYPGNP